MPERKRGIVGGEVYNPMKRGNGRATIFEDDPDHEAAPAFLCWPVAGGRPLGHPPWQRQTVRRLSLKSTLRPPGRPCQEPPKGQFAPSVMT